MASPPPSPKPKPGFRKSVRLQWDKVVRASRPSSPSSPRGRIAQPSSLLGVPDHDANINLRQLNLPTPAADSSDASTENRSTSLITKTDAAKQATSAIWTRLGTALRALQESAGLFPPLRAAVDMFIPCLNVLEEATQYRAEFQDLAFELISSSEFLARYIKEPGSGKMLDCIADVARSIEQQVKLINVECSRSMGRRLLEASSDNKKLMSCYRHIQSSFRKLQVEAAMNAVRIMEEQQMSTRLEALDPANLANHDSTLSTEINRRTCTENTRKDVLSSLDDWSHDPNGADVYWMNGMAGTGKTTIACSFSKNLEDRKQLAASFFCTRSSPECRDVKRIVPTIAYQIAQHSPFFRYALCETIGGTCGTESKAIPIQFERLLKRPLLQVKEMLPNNLVVVIDALDECEDRNGTRLVIEALFRFAVDLPLKFFVTSRPEPEIYEKLRSGSRSSRTVLHLHDIEKSLVQADIEVYLKAELEFMSPTVAQVKKLAQWSGNLFIFAATVVRYIRPAKGSIDPQKRLRSLLAISSQCNKVHMQIDELYAAVLKAALDEGNLENDEMENVRLVLWTTVCVQEPVDVGTISALAGLDDIQQALTALDALRSVIHFSETSGLVSTLHASLPDFIFSKERSRELFCNSTHHNQLLARRCFDTMKTGLRFNICKLESSFVLDEKVHDLEKRVKGAISLTLSYACRYWGNHLRLSAYTDALCTMLDDFLSLRLLFWMEVLNLKRAIGLSAQILIKAKQWLGTRVTSSGIARMTEDARNFVTSFAASPASQSTPHIYISLLPFCPRSSAVFKQYSKDLRGAIKVTGGAMQRREMAALVTWKTAFGVTAVAYSPDGACVAFGCSDGTVSVRSSHDSTLVAGPFEGHTGPVRTVGYSPDGTCIVSGSEDCTVQVWNAEDGTLAVRPFEGHTGSVRSVAYSPDGTRIASASDDRTIRVWSSQGGGLVIGPLKAHTGSVTSVGYSPDGTRIISGSCDRTIRVWDARGGALIAGPLKGHTDSVTSVAYLGKTHIVSGSEDCTVRVWDAQDGTPIADPFEGHTNSVRSVAGLLDGTRIVSGSDDCTIRVWNLQDGTLFAGPFEGHTDWVRSVACSPDGTRIVSGSDDCTIRVWNAQYSVLIPGPLQGHTNSLTSMTYSPDGTHIVSGSDDETIRVWNSLDGTLIAGPFEGHANSVTNSRAIVSSSNDCTIRVWSIQAQDGTPVADPFEGRTGSIRSVAYSPDGVHIASGFDDRTIRVWRAQDGTLIAGPFEGHTRGVRSVAYSPDGTCIASGSDDRTIRVWNAQDGTLISSPFEGHTRSVRSIAYSPDGTRIVSGSDDCTIRVWNAQNGTLIANPLEGHTLGVRSVVYSPDGTRIISGSCDHTIRVWNAQDGTPIGRPFQGHTDSITSVARSPDGTRIVSGSDDGTTLVWDARNGRIVAGPFKGYSGSVTSVAYSPDNVHVVSGFSNGTFRVCKLREPTRSSSLSWALGSDVSSEDLSVDGTDQITISFDLGGWQTNDSGWITDRCASQYYFWVPPDMIRILPSPHNAFVISSDGPLLIDYRDLFIGHHWSKCYCNDSE